MGDVPASIPDALHTVDDYREKARANLPDRLFDRMFGTELDGVGRTDAANRAAFAAVHLRPRVLVDVSRRSLATTVLGQPIDLPVMLAPVGDAARVHPDAELATVAAAGSAGVVTILGMASTYSVDEVVAAARRPVWFQLYVLKSRDMTRRLVEHAEEVGCAGLVVTVDNPGVIARDLAAGAGRKQAWGTLAALGLTEELDAGGLLLENVDPTLTWRDIAWVRSITRLPIVLKGIQTAEDACLCAEHGVAGLVLSNHGGHALPDTLGTLARLPEIVGAAGDVEVFLDGGVRQGADVLKALAVGARAVLLGRAQYWGLAAGGAVALHGLLEVLASELDAAMMFCGVTDVTHVDSRLVASRPA
ncbi:MAG: 4-hydroxymandelate oxidase [Solirubrobacteraceae bacterium]